MNYIDILIDIHIGLVQTRRDRKRKQTGLRTMCKYKCTVEPQEIDD